MATGVTDDLVRLSVGIESLRRHPGRPRGRASAPRRREPNLSLCPSPARGASVTSRGGGSSSRSIASWHWKRAAPCRRSPSRTRHGVSLRPTRRTRSSSCTRSPATATPTGPAGPGHGQAGWWDGLIGPGAPVDTDRWFVVCPNVLGGCQGTTGPVSDAPDGKPYGSRFPRITIRDQVAVEAALADELGIDRWHAVVGGSMGGMRVLEWAVGYPARVARAIVVSVGAQATAEQIGAVQRADPRGEVRSELARRRLLRRRARRRTARRARDRPGRRPDQLPLRDRARRAVRARAARPAKTPSPAVGTRWSPTWSTTASGWCDASTPTPTWCCPKR